MKKRNEGRHVEKQVLKRIKARPQPNSGALPGMPNDGVKGKYLIEVKSTVKKSLGVKWEWLKDLEENAILRSKVAAMVIVFNQDGGGTIGLNKCWVAVPLRDFEKLSLDWRTR